MVSGKNTKFPWFKVLQKLIDSCSAKFTTLVDEMVRGSFAKKRYDWAANGGKLLLYNNPKYAAILAEIPNFPEFVSA